MTNPLRELIERRKRAAEVSDAAWKAERKLFYDYIKDKEGHIADLIDAAQKVEQYVDAIVCYASTIDEHEPNRIAHDLRAALAKLTEGK